MRCRLHSISLPAGNKTSLSQEQLLRQRLLPQQVRFGEFLEKTDEEVAEAVAMELEANPALEVRESDTEPARRIYAPAPASADFDFTPVQADAEPTLREFMQRQVPELDIDERQRRLVLYIIDAVDANGYLTRTLPELIDDLALAAGIEVGREEMRQAYATVRSLDPPGVAAQDLRDTLLLQLRRLDPAVPRRAEAIEIVTHFFDVYSRRNDRRLSDLAGIPVEAVREAHELIKSLNPRPGAAFVSDPTQAMGHAGITPDFIVETDGERITLQMPNTIPELDLEESFREDSTMPGAEEFIRNRRNDALGFIDMLKRRREMLMRVARTIVEHQRAFFVNGDDESALRPLVLRQVAEQVGVDLSTVSRAVSGKWLSTPLGVYSLKSFFTHRGMVDADSDSEPSAPAIRAALRELIDSEDPSSPLSDEALTAALARQGYKLARRTVAKYRTQLNLPPARLRRR